MNDFWQGFEKTALNAQKARALAAHHGLVPEGSWKWGLRNLRKGKTREHLGHAPKAVVNEVKHKGAKVEAGGLWGAKAKASGHDKITKGTHEGVDVGGLQASIAGSKSFQKATASLQASHPSRFFKELGGLNKEVVRAKSHARGMNSIHSHPNTSVTHEILENEKKLPQQLREYKSGVEEHLENTYKEHPHKERLLRIHTRDRQALSDAMTKRHQSSHPILQPSGYRSRSPANTEGLDQNLFHHQGIGTHHNIVSPGIGVGVHTVRPDKEKGGTRLRSLLFKDKS